MTQVGHSLGTSLYMSPEQAAGDHDIDGRRDLYSLASSGARVNLGARDVPDAPYRRTFPFNSCSQFSTTMT